MADATIEVPIWADQLELERVRDLATSLGAKHALTTWFKVIGEPRPCVLLGYTFDGKQWEISNAVDSADTYAEFVEHARSAVLRHLNQAAINDALVSR